MCKQANINTGIKSLDFTQKGGKMTVILDDGRELSVPLTMFPDIKKMPLKDRKDWMVLDEQYFTFAKLSRVFSINELFRV